jgi:hypothetical protein
MFLYPSAEQSVIMFFICFFIYIIGNSFSYSAIKEGFSVTDALVDATMQKTATLNNRVNALEPVVISTSDDVTDTDKSISANTNAITTIIKQRVDKLNKKLGKDVTDPANVPTIS